LAETPSTIITVLGGPTVVASWLSKYLKRGNEINYKTVSNWKGRGIPLRYWKPLLGMASETHVHNRLTPMEFIEAHATFKPRLRKRRAPG